MNGYPYGGYYAQPPPMQQQQQSMYTPHQHPHMMPGPPQGYQQFNYPPHPSQNMPPGPVPVSFDADAYTQDYGNTSTYSKKSKRRQSAPSGSATAPPPLKSAMKKPSTSATPMVNTLDFPGYNGNTSYNANASFNGNASYNGNMPYGATTSTANTGYPLERTRTSSLHGRRRAPSNAAYSQDHGGMDPPFVPLHMFVSFQGWNELHFENITEFGLEEIRSMIFPLWEDGIESQIVTSTECIVKFRNQPWDTSGPNSLMAFHLIQQLFHLCAIRGYTFRTAISIGQAHPRLVFEVAAPEPRDFFIAYFSSGGRKFTLVNPPNHVDLALAAHLKKALGRKLATEHVEGSNLRIIEVKKKPGGLNAPEVEYSLFLAHVLRALSELNFELECSIPLLKKHAMGMRTSQQEIMVYRSTPDRGESHEHRRHGSLRRHEDH